MIVHMRYVLHCNYYITQDIHRYCMCYRYIISDLDLFIYIIIYMNITCVMQFNMYSIYYIVYIYIHYT